MTWPRLKPYALAVVFAVAVAGLYVYGQYVYAYLSLSLGWPTGLPPAWRSRMLRDGTEWSVVALVGVFLWQQWKERRT